MLHRDLLFISDLPFVGLFLRPSPMVDLRPREGVECIKDIDPLINHPATTVGSVPPIHWMGVAVRRNIASGNMIHLLAV